MGFRMESEHQKLIKYLTIIGGHYRREIKMEVGYMCLYQF